MERCALCRATLNGAETCRRCRAELQSVKRVEREGQVLVDAAIHALSLDDFMTAERLLRRALARHAAPEASALWQLVKTCRSGQKHDEHRRLTFGRSPPRT